MLRQSALRRLMLGIRHHFGGRLKLVPIGECHQAVGAIILDSLLHGRRTTMLPSGNSSDYL
jgi:hypothetical protein